MRSMKDKQFILVVHFIFFGSISPSAEASTIYDITINSASSISYTLVASTIVSQNTDEREEVIEGGRYNRLARGY